MHKMSRPAQEDLKKIVIYWFGVSKSREASKKVEAAIKLRCNEISKNPEIGTPYDRAKVPLRVGYAIEARFSIYYRVRGPRSIEVVMIRDNKQARPTAAELDTRL